MPNEMFPCNVFGQNLQVWSSLVVSLQLLVHLDQLHNPNCSSPSAVITAWLVCDSTKFVPYLLCCASVHTVCFLPLA